MKDSLLIFEEKHGNRYFHVTTENDLYLVAKKIFNEREEDGYWYDYANLEEPEKPDISRENIKLLKNEELKNSTIRSWENYDRALRYYQSNLKKRELYDKALNDKFGDICWKFLRTRQNAEYEGFELTSFEN